MKIELDPMHATFNFFESEPLSLEIWKKKYSNNGKDVSHNVTFRRVAHAIAKGDKNLEQDFFELMLAGIFMPAGRILAGAGTGNRVTLMNCFVNETVEDSMEGIMHAHTQTALTMQQGGGMGTNFATIRPSGAILKQTNSIASGPMPFMDMWDSMCATIMSAGSRRGAMMGTISDTHPDLLNFIRAKHKAGVLNNFNVSVLISDAFMEAVKHNQDWVLFFPKEPATTLNFNGIPNQFIDADGVTQYIYSYHKAQDIWNEIMQSTYAYAEPGVIFIDRVNEMNNLNYCENISCTNPCGEQPLPPNGACNLSAINLARLVKDPFKTTAFFDLELFTTVIKKAVKFLDNVIDVSGYPLKEQEEEQWAKRRIGLGITGFADMLIQLGISYGSPVCIALIEKIGSVLANVAYQTSAHLAKEIESFQLYNDMIEASAFIIGLEKTTQDHIRSYGLRNGVLLTLAPTGTTSIFYGNVSSSLEPNFAFQFDRKVRDDNGETYTTHQVSSFIKRFAAHCGIGVQDQENDVWVTANEITPQDHLNVQIAWQKWIDASISKTINLPSDIPFEDFENIYMKAFEGKCKGCTTYRPSEVRGSILSVTKAPEVKGSTVTLKIEVDQESLIAAKKAIEPKSRPEVVPGNTYKLKWPSMNSALYMTVNMLSEEPFEIFFASKDTRYQDWTTALSLTITTLFRAGLNTRHIIDEYKQVTSTTDTAWIQGKFYPSLIAYIGSKLDEAINGSDIAIIQEVSKESAIIGSKCNVCGQMTVQVIAGCKTCANCGDSKCQ